MGRLSWDESKALISMSKSLESIAKSLEILAHPPTVVSAEAITKAEIPFVPDTFHSWRGERYGPTIDCSKCGEVWYHSDGEPSRGPCSGVDETKGRT